MEDIHISQQNISLNIGRIMWHVSVQKPKGSLPIPILLKEKFRGIFLRFPRPLIFQILISLTTQKGCCVPSLEWIIWPNSTGKCDVLLWQGRVGIYLLFGNLILVVNPWIPITWVSAVVDCLFDFLWQFVGNARVFQKNKKQKT